MDAVWSLEFLVALLCFLSPVALAAVLVYRRVLKSNLRRKRRPSHVTDAGARRVLEQAGPQAAAVASEPAPVPLQALWEPLENLRQSLVEFRTSIQHSRTALGALQECDCKFTMDLNRASEVMHHAFSE